MFYVRTADRLQRTSVWMGTLEGGLDYLKQVVSEDSLGIAGELEEQMESIVGSYQCEWKTTVEDPEKLKRFRQFVNSKAEDREIIFVEERGQPRPATDAERKQLLAESSSKLPLSPAVSCCLPLSAYNPSKFTPQPLS